MCPEGEPGSILKVSRRGQKVNTKSINTPDQSSACAFGLVPGKFGSRRQCLHTNNKAVGGQWRPVRWTNRDSRQDSKGSTRRRNRIHQRKWWVRRSPTTTGRNSIHRCGRGRRHRSSDGEEEAKAITPTPRIAIMARDPGGPVERWRPRCAPSHSKWRYEIHSPEECARTVCEHTCICPCAEAGNWGPAGATAAWQQQTLVTL